MTDRRPTIGFIGLGIVGAPAARNLMAAGDELTVLENAGLVTVLEDLAGSRVADAVAS